MRLDGLRRDEQRLGDLTVAHAAGGHAGEPFLARGECVAAAGPGPAWPVGAYRFNFEIPALNQDATLEFTIDLSQLDDATRQAVLEGAQEGTATIAVKGDEEGAAYQALRRCGNGETPQAKDCVAVELLDAEGNPTADPGQADFVRFSGITGHFSTFAVALVEPICTGPLAPIAELVEPLLRPVAPDAADLVTDILCGRGGR